MVHVAFIEWLLSSALILSFNQAALYDCAAVTYSHFRFRGIIVRISWGLIMPTKCTLIMARFYPATEAGSYQDLMINCYFGKRETYAVVNLASFPSLPCPHCLQYLIT